MLLRERQHTFVESCIGALKEHGNTLGVAPTGAGKTVMLSAIAGSFSGAKTLICQHRNELVNQNSDTFRIFNPGVEQSLFTADKKDWSGEAVFAMEQTLKLNLDNIPTIDLMVIDEAHHAAADGYLRIIDALRKTNPKMMLYGTTATPERGDKKTLRCVFDNCADEITIDELIESGHLVRPRTMVIDIGTQEALKGVKKTLSDFDMDAVAEIMDKAPINDIIVEKWKELAGTLKTVVFASTVAHAEHLAQAWRDHGFKAEVIHGDMSDGDRAKALRDFERGDLQVLINCMILTEGWDCQIVGCIVLTRPCSYRSTMIQMIGRGLRKVDPERFPGVVKDTCIVIDYGTSIITHGDLSAGKPLTGHLKECPECKAKLPGVNCTCPLCGHDFGKEEAPTKTCPECTAQVPLATQICSCGHIFEKEGKAELENFVLTEIDILKKSPFRWEMFYHGILYICSAITSWSVVVHFGGRWHSLGGSSTSKGMKYISNSHSKIEALASADDFMCQFGDRDTANKSRSWLKLPPTDKQLAYLNLPQDLVLQTNRYRAACMMTWKFNERGIRAKLETAAINVSAA